MAKNIETSLENLDLENSKLSDLFDKAWKSQQELYKSSDESSSVYEMRRKRTIQVLEKCKFMIEELGLFSENESLEEISTSELRYFLNEALIGWLISKINSTKPEIRLTALRQARENYLTYLKQTRNYEFHQLSLDKYKNNANSAIEEVAALSAGSSQSSKQAAFDNNMINQAHERSEKIRRYKEQKEVEAQMDKMNLILASAHTDEDQKRDFFNSFIKYWINKAVDELKLLDEEILMLSRFESSELSADARNQSQKAQASASNVESSKKPFIITKNQLQAAVFGAGYPSLPVYSIDQFYDQLQERGMMPACGARQGEAPVQIGGGVTETQKEKEKAERDDKEDLHDDELVRQQREWDEFKDENKRGSGNRYNRS